MHMSWRFQPARGRFRLPCVRPTSEALVAPPRSKPETDGRSASPPRSPACDNTLRLRLCRCPRRLRPTPPAEPDTKAARSNVEATKATPVAHTSRRLRSRRESRQASTRPQPQALERAVFDVADGNGRAQLVQNAPADSPRRADRAGMVAVVAHGDDMWRSRNTSCRMNVE